MDCPVSGEMEISALCCDSREAQPGCLFAALPGTRQRGADFISQAVGRGAVCVLCQAPPELPVPYVLVKDIRLALGQIASRFYGEPERQLKLIGVTGTNGKTTCTQLLFQMLEELTHAPVGLIGTNENRIGQRHLPARRTTPDVVSLYALLGQMAAAGCRYAVMEVSSHALAQQRTAGLHFAVAAFTNLSRDHLDYHGTMENYASEKAKLFSCCEAAVYRKGDAWAERITAAAPRRYAVGRSIDCDLVGWVPRYFADRVEFLAVDDECSVAARMPVPGEFSLQNALVALGVMETLHFPLRDSAAALSRCCGVRGRMEVVPTGKDFTVLIDYAHTPDGLRNVLSAIRGFSTGRIVVLFGCGGERDRGKRPLMTEEAERGADALILTSDNPRGEDPYAILQQMLPGLSGQKPFTVIEDRRQAIAYALHTARRGDVILLAGKGHELSQERNGALLAMDERQMVSELLS